MRTRKGGMKADEIKARVPIINVLRYYGGTLNGKGIGRCLFPERHHHGDADPSMSVYEDRLFCHSQHCFGEKGADIFEFVGMMERLPNFCEQKRRVLEIAGLNDHIASQSRREVAHYDYCDKSGTLLFQVVRSEPKDFRQRRPDGQGGWTWNLKDTRMVLYRLSEVLLTESVLLLEGEKDVETAYRLGLPEGWAATCNPMGAGKWRAEYSEILHDKYVVILPDADEAGRRHMETVQLALRGFARSVSQVTLPDGAKDLSEWASSGRTATDLHHLLETATPYRGNGNAANTLVLTPLRDLLNEPEERTDWLVENRLPSGGLSLLCGKPKAGKTTLARNLALSVSRGIPWLGFLTVRGKVFYLALEEKRSEVRKHFAAMGAGASDEVHVFCAPSPVDGLVQLRQASERDKPALVIVDPLLKMIRVKDANDYAAVTGALEPLLTLARQTGAPVLAVHYMGKGKRDGGDAILGSTAIFAVVDTALLLKRSEKYQTLSTIQRYGEDLEEVTLSMDTETGLISIGLSRKEADMESVAGSIIDYLATQIEPVEESVIQENVDGRKGIKAKALRRLVEEGKVTRDGVGKKGKPFVYSKAGFLVPLMSGELANEKKKSDQTPCSSGGNAGSYLFAGSETSTELSELGTEEVVVDET